MEEDGCVREHGDSGGWGVGSWSITQAKVPGSRFKTTGGHGTRPDRGQVPTMGPSSLRVVLSSPVRGNPSSLHGRAQRVCDHTDAAPVRCRENGPPLGGMQRHVAALSWASWFLGEGDLGKRLWLPLLTSLERACAPIAGDVASSADVICSRHTRHTRA